MLDLRRQARCLLCSTVTAGALTWLVPGSAAADHDATIIVPPPPPEPVMGGEPVGVCGWPSVVAVQLGGYLCTGTLIHPQVVVYAAHCAGGNQTIRFSESLSGGQTVPGQCKTFGEFDGSASDQGDDFAFCVLQSPVTSVPLTPPVYGCETDVLTPGQEIAMVGFGDISPNSGRGTKRWGKTIIGSITADTFDTVPGEPGPCLGDSGGPALVQFPDGSWRSIGVVSTMRGQCSGQGTLGLLHLMVPWIESQSGFDVTPCHEQDGTWAPTPDCAGFFAGDQNGHGTWSNWCEGTPRSEPSSTCGPAFNAEPDPDPPTATITVPMDLQRFEVGEFAGVVEIDADDGDGNGVRRVQLEINGELQPAEDTSAPWGFSGVSFPAGSWTLVAIAEDWSENVGRSPPVTIGVGEDPSPPPPGGDGGDSGGDDPDAPGDPDDWPDDWTGTGAPPGADRDADGCGCRGHAPHGTWWLVLVGGGLCRRRRTGTE